MDAMQRLHETLDRRPPPEVVCKLIIEACGSRLTSAQRRVLHRLGAAPAGVYSSRSEDFDRPHAAVHKVRTLMVLFGKDLSDDAVTQIAADPWVLLGQLQFLAPFLGWMGGDFTACRALNREQRADMGIDIPRRRYRRLVRQLRQTQQHAYGQQQQILLRQLQLVAHSGMAYSITLEEMRGDPYAAAFVAYWVAQHNRRRKFTTAGRENPFDVVAQMLLARCEFAGNSTDWWMIARAYPHPDVLRRIGGQRRGELMAQWMQFLRLAADMMQAMQSRWPADFDQARMVVRKGMDSSTWNTLAGSYNAARAGWIACLTAADSLRLLNPICPGKAARLIQGRRSDPQTAVWAALPKPWEVLGEGTPNSVMSCTARTVELVCGQHGVDPRATGWTAPLPDGAVAEWAPTPDLVHGIEIGDPVWAQVLRTAGAFSGKPRAETSDVVRAYLTQRQGTA